MVFGYVAEGVAAFCAHIGLIHKDRVDIVAVVCGDYNSERIPMVHDRAGRSYRTAFTCRRCHRVFVNGKQS